MSNLDTSSNFLYKLESGILSCVPLAVQPVMPPTNPGEAGPSHSPAHHYDLRRKPCPPSPTEASEAGSSFGYPPAKRSRRHKAAYSSTYSKGKRKIK